MKKLFVAVVAIAALCACGSGEKKYLDYRGLSMGMPFKTFCDSLMARGFAIDSAKTDSDFATVSMFNPNLNYRIMMAQKNDTLMALQENYSISTNDSTRKMWQQMHDQFEKQIVAWPNML